MVVRADSEHIREGFLELGWVLHLEDSACEAFAGADSLVFYLDCVESGVGSGLDEPLLF